MAYILPIVCIRLKIVINSLKDSRKAHLVSWHLCIDSQIKISFSEVNNVNNLK